MTDAFLVISAQGVSLLLRLSQTKLQAGFTFTPFTYAY